MAGIGIKAYFFSGKNASAVPLWSTILGIFALGYTIDYQSQCSFISNVDI
jgi:F-type H+-transporting ATPase subunit f